MKIHPKMCDLLSGHKTRLILRKEKNNILMLDSKSEQAQPYCTLVLV